MKWLSAIPVIGSFFDSIGNVIDKNVTSDEERLKLKAEMISLSVPVMQALISAQAAFDDAKLKLATIEVQSADRFVRWTRPLMSWLTFVIFAYAVVTNHPNVDLAFYAFGLVAGLFSATRGMEKIAGKWTNGRH